MRTSFVHAPHTQHPTQQLQSCSAEGGRLVVNTVLSLVAFVVLHFIVHIILSIDMARSERSAGVGDTDTGPKMTIEEDGGDKDRSSSLRVLTVVFYMLVAWAMAIAMITAVFQV